MIQNPPKTIRPTQTDHNYYKKKEKKGREHGDISSIWPYIEQEFNCNKVFIDNIADKQRVCIDKAKQLWRT